MTEFKILSWPTGGLKAPLQVYVALNYEVDDVYSSD